MRSRVQANGLTVHAVAGTYNVHLGFDVAPQRRRGLLGFGMQRTDVKEGETKWIPNKRTFSGHEGDRDVWPSSEAPIQKFRWGDYTAKPGRAYSYAIHPAYGKPGALRLENPVTVQVKTEDPEGLDDGAGRIHGVHFSRSGAASQAYVRRFGQRRPDEIPGGAALSWLSRGLLEALLSFIDGTSAGDELVVAAYEIHYEPILSALRSARDRGVALRIMYDAGTAKTGPASRNQAALAASGLTPNARPRQGLRSYISHHKFIVHSRGGLAARVWTGSTNMSLNGIYAQLNVGHSVDDQALAAAYASLFEEIWNSDPTAKVLRGYMTQTYPNVKPPSSSGTSWIFSPRSKEEALEYYLDLMANARELVVLTTPFGIDRRIESFLMAQNPVLIKMGLTGAAGRYGGQVNRVDSIDGTLYSMPARIDSILDRWQIEQWGLTSHAYIHTKFILIDPFQADPVLVTGSANFSKASCTNNDENMLVIQGHKSVCDVYLTEFLRMFEHYAFRHIVETNRGVGVNPLDDSDQWTDRYFQVGSERERERLLFAGNMKITS